ncbi:GntR-family transcriptional regulator [Clostridium botulinum A3 str. Loch Maree]|nr:GntR-family transcriptional regulator [Clostridium botulinum A3 str. Loch Maree]
MKILISNASEQPIYEQILCQIKGAIIQGELKEEEILPLYAYNSFIYNYLKDNKYFKYI